jgi:CHAD domain-containing protein
MAAPTAAERIVAAGIAAEHRVLAQIIRDPARMSVRDVHRARVAARRLRSILKTFDPVLHHKRARVCRKQLRQLARSLAGTREADVTASVLRDVSMDAPLDEESRQRLRTTLAGWRRDVRTELRAVRAQPDWQLLARTLIRTTAPGWLLRDEAVTRQHLLRMTQRPWRRALQLLDGNLADPTQLHELRLALKHCRYALEILPDPERALAAVLLRRLRKTQDAIGIHRDTELTRQWVRQHRAELGPHNAKTLSRALRRYERRLHRECLQLCERLPQEQRRWLSRARNPSR